MTHSIIAHERELSLAEAYARVLQELACLGLVGSAHTLGERVVNTRVTLTDAHTTPKGAGSGKGYADSALVGAYFEALEHYLSEHHEMHAGIEMRPANRYARDGFFHDDSLLDCVIQHTEAHIASRQYHSPLDTSTFYYPVAFSLPAYSARPLAGDTFDYAGIRRYFSNSGIAIGATYNEAALHAINECLERDALSLFLLRHFYYQQDRPLRRVQRPQPPHPLATLWQDVESELDADVVLLDISSEFCVNTYLAFSLGDNRPIGLFGCGTSLSAPHAAERALTELVQLRLSATLADTARHLERQWRHLAPFPRLQRCLHLDIDGLMSTSRQQCVTLPADCEHRTLDEQIRVIAHNVRSHNRELGISILYQSDSGTTLANVVIPGLERFYIVSTGNVVIPQARGQALNECYG